MTPAFGGFYQSAYVTTDLEQAMELFKETYAIPRFLVSEADYPVRYRGQPRRMHLRLALANLAGVQIEVIQALEGCVDLYREGLPARGFGLAHHHVAVRVEGDLEAWDRWRREVGDARRGVALEGELGASARFVYLDDRPSLGHYTEYLWTTAEARRHMDSDIPCFPECA